MGRCFLAYSTDPRLRRMASSGGFTKAFLSFLLDSGHVDQLVIARTGSESGPFQPGFILTGNKRELLQRRTNSVYYPVDPFGLESQLTPETRCAITLLPCQVETLRALQERGRFGNIRLVIELLCNYTPKPRWTSRILERMGLAPESAHQLFYRGEGWPGMLTAISDHKEVRLPFDGVWSQDVAAHGLERCVHCGRLWGPSDVLVADPWRLASDMGPGKTLLRVNKDETLELVQDAARSGYLTLEPLAEEAFARAMRPHVELKQRRSS